jgi:hypothetical protein
MIAQKSFSVNENSFAICFCLPYNVGKKGGSVMRNSKAKPIALGGVLAALAVVIMSIGGMIPVATFVLPMLCCLILNVVLRICGVRIAWAWYGAVAILGMLLSPDKEAAAVFVFLGYYPILKPIFDGFAFKWLWKGLFFNAVILAMYQLLMHVFGMHELAHEWQELGFVMTVVMLVLGNITFFLLDNVLSKRFRKKR